MKETVAVDPVQWLRTAPIPVTSPEHVLSGFDRSREIAVTRFRGPHSFYRMAGFDETRGAMTTPYGSWWVDESALASIYARINRYDIFEGWVPAAHLAQMKSLPVHYRALAAICEDWNDFREQVKLTIPAGEELTGLTGTVAPQPVRSSMDRASRKTPWLPGMLEQVYFKRGTATEASINPFWVHWVKLF